MRTGNLSQAVLKNETFWLRHNAIYDCVACDVQDVHGISVCTTGDIADSSLLSHNAN